MTTDKRLTRVAITTLLVILLAGVLAAQQKSGAKTSTTEATASGLPSEETVSGFLHETFGYDSSLTYRVAEIKPSEIPGMAEVTVVISTAQGQQSNKLYVSQDGKHALIGDVVPFGAHPFAADRAKLDAGVNGPSRGPAKAPVTIVEFSDLQCPHCKEVQPKIETLLAAEPNVKLIFQNFPLPMHDWANKAADYADCIGRASNDAFWKFVQGVYDAQADITAANADDKLKAIADASGAKSADIAVCAAKPETQTRVEKSLALGKEVGVNSTPTIFINGRKVGSLGVLPDEVFKSLVDFAAK